MFSADVRFLRSRKSHQSCKSFVSPRGKVASQRRGISDEQKKMGHAEFRYAMCSVTSVEMAWRFSTLVVVGRISTDLLFFSLLSFPSIPAWLQYLQFRLDPGEKKAEKERGIKLCLAVREAASCGLDPNFLAYHTSHYSTNPRTGKRPISCTILLHVPPRGSSSSVSERTGTRLKAGLWSFRMAVEAG